MASQVTTVGILILTLAITVYSKGRPQMYELFDDENEYENSETPILDSDDDVPEHIEDPKLRRFMEALIFEAGKHALYPPKGFIDHVCATSKDTNHDHAKGQPEYEDLGLGPQVDCPEDCTTYHPVCGNDGRVYDSLCHLRKDNCGKDNLTIGDWELCRGKHFLCPKRCLEINDPVCGQDGQMYKNICVMRRSHCGKFLITKPIKFCYRRTDAEFFDDCPENCPEIYRPVCGSDNSIYYNECFLKMRTCGENVQVVDMESCATSTECPERCIPIYDPVCGSDGNIYSNICRMQLENCGKSIVTRMPHKFCHKEE